MVNKFSGMFTQKCLGNLMLVLENALRQLLRICNMESDYLVTEWEAETLLRKCEINLCRHTIK